MQKVDSVYFTVSKSAGGGAAGKGVNPPSYTQTLYKDNKRHY